MVSFAKTMPADLIKEETLKILQFTNAVLGRNIPSPLTALQLDSSNVRSQLQASPFKISLKAT